MSYHGDYRAGDTVDFKFSTVNSSAVPATLGGTPAISIYKSNSTTESTAGVTLTVDFDSLTGLNHIRVTTVTDGTFYADATDFDAIITTGTVGGVSVVGMVVGSFSLSNRSALRPTVATRTLDVSAGGEAGVDWANVGSPTTSLNLSGTSTKALEPTTAGRTLDVTATGEAGIDWNNIGAPTTAVNLSGTSTKALEPTTAGRTLDVSATGEGGVDWANVGGQGTTVNLSATTTNLVNTVTTYTGNTVQTGDSFALIGVAGAGLTNINLPDQTMDITGNITGDLSGSVGSVSGNVTGTIGGLTAVALKDFFDTDSTTTYASAVAGSVVKEIADNAGGSALTPGAIADAVWDEATAGHASAGTYGVRDGYRLSATGVDDILDEVVEGSYTVRQYLRGFGSALLAKLSGMVAAAPSSPVFRDAPNTKDRITATTDAAGNRTAVTLDLT